MATESERVATSSGRGVVVALLRRGPGIVGFIVLARFALVSLIGTGVDFLVLWLLVAHAGWAVLPAKLVATEATIINTFVWNNAWTFRDRAVAGPLLARFLSFNATYAASLALALGAVGALVVAFGPRHYLLYNVATLPLNFVWNYLWSTRVIWRGRPAPASPADVARAERLPVPAEASAPVSARMLDRSP